MQVGETYGSTFYALRMFTTPTAQYFLNDLRVTNDKNPIVDTERKKG